jgi:DNA-binding CsgD family transcriptional regulator
MMPRERLTLKEMQVAILLWQGLTNREIGKIIGTTEPVFKNHLRSAFDKLGVWSRLELAMYVASHGEKNWPAESEPAETQPPTGLKSSQRPVSNSRNRAGRGRRSLHLNPGRGLCQFDSSNKSRGAEYPCSWASFKRRDMLQKVSPAAARTQTQKLVTSLTTIV